MSKLKGEKLPSLQQQRLHQMTTWLKQNGAELEGLQLAYLEKGYRGIVTTRPIQKKDRIVFIPKRCLITLEMCMADPISRTVLESQVGLISPKHTFMAIYLLQQRINPKSVWQPYLALLPQDQSCFPINYNNDQLSQLVGSPFLMTIHQKIADLKKDFATVCGVSAEFHRYTFKEFCWARMMVGSRMFGVHIDGKKTNILAPFADMFNHRLPKQTSWSYVQCQQGLSIESLTDIQPGLEVFDSYGRKCNSRYLLNYGFIVPQNFENGAYFRLSLLGSPFAKRKLEMTQLPQYSSKVLKVSKNLNDSHFYDTIGYLRFKTISSEQHLAILEQIAALKVTNEPYIPSKTPPITMDLEIEVWSTLRELCLQSLRKYPTSVEEDEQILDGSNLSENMRNILTLRCDEKKIYREYTSICLEVINILKLGYLKGWDAACQAEGKLWQPYLLKMYSAMPHQKRKQLGYVRKQSIAKDQGGKQAD